MSDWKRNERQFSERCRGRVWQYRGIHWHCIYEEPDDGNFCMQLHAHGKAQNLRQALNDCDAAAIAMQERFPSLIIIAQRSGDSGPKPLTMTQQDLAQYDADGTGDADLREGLRRRREVNGQALASLASGEPTTGGKE